MRASAAAVGGAALGACAKSATDPLEPTALVAAVRGNDLYSMSRDALEGLGGVGGIVHDGETVFIKPNMVTLPWASSGNCFANGECTKPEIIIAVTEECLKAGAAEVTIGDGSHLPTLNWELAATLDGSTNLVREAARLSSQYGRTVRVASLEVDSPAWDELPSRTYLGTIAVSSLVARADRVISIPVAKTHSWAQLTLSLKNFVGVTPLERYAGWVDPGYWDRGKEFDHSSPDAIAAIYLDIVDGVKPDLAVVDFSIGIEGDGPGVGHGGRTVDMRQRLGSWLLLAGTDLVAADATVARIMGHDVFDQRQLTMGYDMGLGEIRKDRIELVGERLEDLRVEWLPAQLRNQLASARASPVTRRPGCPLVYTGAPCSLHYSLGA
ncbi:MAG: DUF362 domain-containing protein [Gemmatimonadales bacterium]|nr:DUF362 domain-containing protein [Gemmatimonadales bacterium]